MSKEFDEKLVYDILVVGAGPAGLTAAIYGTRGGKSVLVLEKLSYGGQIINTPEVENYPGAKRTSGFELATSMYEQAIELGAKMEFGEVVEIERCDEELPYFLVKTKNAIGEPGPDYEAKSIILATGVKSRELGLPREEQLTGAGISYCATCDGAFFRGKDVAVLGGGNTALEDAEYMAELAKKVYLVHRRNEFRGDEITVKRLAEKENVEFVLDSVPVEILGEPRVDGLKVKNVKSNEERVLEVEAIFVAFGRVADNQGFANLVDLNDAGFFNSGEDCVTKTQGVFVAGDAREKTRRQLVTATADGAVSAMAAIEYLHNLG